MVVILDVLVIQDLTANLPTQEGVVPDHLVITIAGADMTQEEKMPIRCLQASVHEKAKINTNLYQ